MSAATAARRRLRDGLAARRWRPDLSVAGRSDEERRYLSWLHDRSVALRPRPRWSDEAVEGFLDPRSSWCVCPSPRGCAGRRRGTPGAPGSSPLAVNIHAFSECSQAAIAWWTGQARRLRIPRLLIVPNEPDGLLSLEPDASRRPYGPLLEAAGYWLVHREPVIDDPAVSELVRLDDHFYLFAREPTQP